MFDDTMVTLSQSDAILAADIVEIYIQDSKNIMSKEDIEEAESLLQLIKNQINSVESL